MSHHSAIASTIAARARRRMRVSLVFVASGAVLACSSSETLSPPVVSMAPSLAEAAHGVEARPIPGQYIVTFADSVSDVPGLAREIAARSGVQPMFTYTAALKGFAARLPDQAVEALRHNPRIRSIEQDQVA